MDKRTRVLNAMNKKEVDHVPVGFWFHFAGEEASGQGCINAHLKYYRETDLDFVKIMCDGYFPYPLPEIKTAADWKSLKPLTSDHPFIREQVERAKAIVEDIGKERCVFYNVFAPFSSLRFGAEAVGLTDSDVMEYIREDKNAVMDALDVIAQSNALLAELLITEAGCDGVYYCVQGGEYDRFTPEEYRKTITPSDLYVLEHANRFSENNIIHMCGWAGNRNQLAIWQDYPGKGSKLGCICGRPVSGCRPLFYRGQNLPGRFRDSLGRTHPAGNSLYRYQGRTAEIHHRSNSQSWQNRIDAGRGLHNRCKA